VAIEWYDGGGGPPAPGAPTLALALDNGRLQLMGHASDDAGVCVDTGLRVTHAKWSRDGRVLAVAGVAPAAAAAGGGPGGRDPWLVQFYSAAGDHLRTLRVPAGAGGGGGSGAVAGIAWEGSGLRLAVAVDASVLLAAVRREHLWGYMAGGTLAYAYARPERAQEHCVVFWDTRTGVRCARAPWAAGAGRAGWILAAAGGNPVAH
jgi:WD repeat-containing protein 35